MSLKWLSYLLMRQYSQNTASLFQKIPLWSQKVERCLCLVQNQALIEHYDHEVQSKRIVKLIQAMLVPDCQ